MIFDFLIIFNLSKAVVKYTSVKSVKSPAFKSTSVKSTSVKSAAIAYNILIKKFKQTNYTITII